MAFQTPQTLTGLQLAFDQQAWTATEVKNPAVALIDCRSDVGVLLARDVVEGPDGTEMRGVTWIRIPRGWRLAATRLVSRFMKVHFPDEWLFNGVLLTQSADRLFVARVGNVARHPLVLPTPRSEPYPLRALTGNSYWRLAGASGGLLHAQVVAMFPEDLGNEQRAVGAHVEAGAWAAVVETATGMRLRVAVN